MAYEHYEGEIYPLYLLKEHRKSLMADLDEAEDMIKRSKESLRYHEQNKSTYEFRIKEVEETIRNLTGDEQ